MSITNLNDKPMKTRVLVLYYTILFAIISAGVFSVFILLGKSFVPYSDGFRQGFFWVAELKHIIASVLAGDGIPQWNWSRGLGMQYLYRCDPFNLFAALFPIKYLELGITISLILKLYCGGLAYLAFARDLKMSNYQCIIGPVCYIFSTWFISVTMVQSSFIFIAFMMPLLFLGIDRIYRGKAPVLFILVVAYFLIRDTYLAYMAGIVSIMFIFLRYFAYADKFEIKDYFSKIGKIFAYGLTAVMLSAAFCLQFALATMRASTESVHHASHLLANSSYFFGFGRTLMTTGYMSGYTYIGIPILAILVLPLALKKTSLKNTASLMTAILLLMTCFQFFSRMFNGFSYGTGRWFVFIVFFASWATLEQFDIEKLREKKNLIVMSVWLVILAIWTLGFDAADLIGLSLRAKAFIALNLMTGAALIFVIGAFKTPKITIKHRQIATVAVSALMLIVGWSMSFYLYNAKFIEVGNTSDRLDNSTQRVSASIDDDGFYRTDQVDWLNFNQAMEMPCNENLWWQSKSIYVYDSFTSSRQLELNKYVGNNYGYLMRVYLVSNDNRAGLDFLEGVKYFLGENDRLVEESGLSSDNFAGYGFSYMDTIDGVHVLKNKYDSGIGFGYDKCISETEFLKLSRTEREQALLQAVVIPDDEINVINGNIERLTAKDIETDVKPVDFEITEMNGMTMEDGKILVTQEGASFKVNVHGIENSQVIVSFDNLVKADNKAFTVHCKDGRVDKVFHTGRSNQCIPDITDFDLNMGYYDNYDGTYTVTVNHAGEYTYDKFYISAMNMDNYDKYASQRIASRYNVSEYDNRHVSGTVDIDTGEILYFSIPQYTNWEIYVDGSKTTKIEDANIAFLAAEVPAGHHDVVLKYNNKSLKLGIAASIIGLILTIIFGLYFRRKSREDN